MKNMRVSSKKVIIATTLAASLAFSGTALASDKGMTGYIKDMITSITASFNAEIKAYVDERSKHYSSEIEKYIISTHSIIESALNDFKTAEKARAENELKKYYQQKVNEIEAIKEKEMKAEQDKIAKSTNEDITQGKAEIDASVSKQMQ